MPIGDMNKRVEIQAPSKVPDGMGGFTSTFNTIATVFCAIWPTSASQTIASLQPLGTITHRIRIRWRSNFRSTYRLKFGNRIFDIVGPAINPSEKNEYLDLMCKEAA